MGNPNTRGQEEFVRVARKFEMKKLAKQQEITDKKEAENKLWTERKAAWEKQKLEKKEDQEKKLADKKVTEENAMKIAATMQFEYIQKHYALTLKNNGDAKQLFIELNFIADPPTDMLALMKVLPEYSPAITNVQINLLSPIQHGPRAIYHQRVENMKKLMDQLNSFPITVLNISVDIDGHDSFQQLKLAAAVNGLVFQDWTMDYQIWGGKTFFKIERHSSYAKRLRGVYRAEFGAI